MVEQIDITQIKASGIAGPTTALFGSITAGTGNWAVPSGGVTGSTSPVSGDAAEWDTNLNLSANNHISTSYTQALSSSTYTMTIASAQTIIFTGTTQNQVVTLPPTAAIGQQWLINNNGTTATVTCNGSTSGTPVILAGGTSAVLTALSATPTTAAGWDAQYGGVAVTSGKIANITGSLTFTGTDGTSHTFPSTSSVLARTDAANTFTGVQTMTSPALTTPVLGTPTSGTLTNCTGYVPTNLSTAVTNAFLPDGIINAAYAQQSQVVVAGTAYYITNSALVMPATAKAGMVAASSALLPGTHMRWRIAFSKTAAGTAAFNIIIYRGTNHTTSDTADVTQSIGTGTAVVDDMIVDIQLVVTTTGASGAYYWTMIPVNSASAIGTAAGFGVPRGTASAWKSGTVSSVAMNTASLAFGIGFSNTTGTPTITVPLVEANCYNMD